MKYITIISLAGSVALSIVSASALVIAGDSSAVINTSMHDAVKTDVKVNVGINANQRSQSVSSTSGSVNVNLGTKGETSVAEYNARVEVASETILFSRSDVDTDTKAQVEIDSENKVNTNADLAIFARTLIKRDKKASNVEVKDNSVSLEYESMIKLFGFLPIATHTTATVQANGDTTISYPWYATFATTNEANLNTKIKSSVSSYVNTQAKADAKLSTSAKAQVLAKMYGAMKTDLEASASAKTSVEAK